MPRTPLYGNSAGRGGLRVRNLLVGLEVGLSAVLVTAGLLIASFVRLMTVDKGFQVDRVLAMNLSLLSSKYPQPAERAAFFQRALDTAARLLAGMAAGALSAVAIGRYLESLLWDVSPRDPLAFAVSGAVLLVVSAAACLVPARRATRVSPIEALRFE
jgi:ABC-type lipoprotein release transport system permease subunit